MLLKKIHKQVILTEILLSLLNEGNQTNKQSIFFLLFVVKNLQLGFIILVWEHTSFWGGEWGGYGMLFNTFTLTLT